MSWEERAYYFLHEFIQKYNSAPLGTHIIPEEWIVGIIYNENSLIEQPKRSRFEPHVFDHVMIAKKGQKSLAFPGFNSGKIGAFIKNTSDIAKLKSVATSYGLSQIMGYHFINWGVAPEEYMNLTVEQSVKYTIQFARERIATAFKNATSTVHAYERLLRIWNTGSPTGKTFNSDYVTKAQTMAAKYRQVMENKKGA